MKRSRWLCAVLVPALAWGALGLPTAVAQQQTPAPGPARAPIVTAPYEPTDADRVRADYLNVVYVPGKAIICGAGVLASTGVMLLSLGSAYRDAVGFLDEGCGGKWMLTPGDVAVRRAPKMRY
ncbi:MAG: hypothetical protein HY712_01365 [candidate division NC10 bacterium]|nr:hypothetical protein [candidate division NC10 bacterium]